MGWEPALKKLLEARRPPRETGTAGGGKAAVRDTDWRRPLGMGEGPTEEQPTGKPTGRREVLERWRRGGDRKEKTQKLVSLKATVRTN